VEGAVATGSIGEELAMEVDIQGVPSITHMAQTELEAVVLHMLEQVAVLMLPVPTL